MNKKQWLILVLILILGTFLRFWKLGETPRGFYSDEAALGYNALSIMKTGKDEYGMVWPILLRSFADFKAPVYMYLLIPIYKIFGVSVWSTRFLSAIAGTVIVWLGFLITKNLSKNIRLSLITALLMAISPWLIIFSRTCYETNLSLMWLMIMIWSFYKSRKNKNWLILTAVTAGVSFLAYHSERMVTPLVLLVYLIKERKNVFAGKRIKILVVSFLVGLLIVLPTLKLMATPGFLSRLNSLSILSRQPWGFSENLNGWKNIIFNNQIILKFKEFSSLYTAYFSPRYLFGLGDPIPRNAYPDLGPFWFWQLPFWLFGWFWLFKKTNKEEENELKFLVILIMIVSPIPAALTKDPFSAIRALPLAWPLLMVTAVGIERWWKRFGGIIGLILVILTVWSMGKAYLSGFKFNDYFRGYAWDEGIEEMVSKIKDEELPVVVDNTRGEIYSQILFFTQADPKKYQTENFEVSEEDYYTNMKRNEIKKVGNISVRPIVWEKDVYQEQILVGDALSINEEQINEHCLTLRFEIEDSRGKIIFRGFKTHPEDKSKFEIGDKIDGKMVKKCIITNP